MLQAHEKNNLSVFFIFLILLIINLNPENNIIITSKKSCLILKATNKNGQDFLYMCNRFIYDLNWLKTQKYVYK